jgi:hypothetical protein
VWLCMSAAGSEAVLICDTALRGCLGSDCSKCVQPHGIAQVLSMKLVVLHAYRPVRLCSLCTLCSCQFMRCCGVQVQVVFGAAVV